MLSSEEYDIQQRLLYLCQGFGEEKAINNLLRVAYDASPKISTTTRIRALNILLQFASMEGIQKVHKYEDILYVIL
jgi:hypothetical protein